MILDTCLGMDDAALIRERQVGACQDVSGNRLSEDFDAESICNDFFGFSFDVWVDESDATALVNS